MFCTGCGARLELICAACNVRNSLESRYCRQCGDSLSEGQPTGSQDTRPYDTQVGGTPSQTWSQEAAPTFPASSGPTPTTHSCPRCKLAIQPGAAFCFSCGLPFDEGATAPSRSHSLANGTLRQVIPAGFWIRLAAYVIDFIILGVSQLIFLLFPAGMWIGLFLPMVYYTISVSSYSTTVGKKALGLYVLRPDGSKLGLGRALGRYFASILSGLILFIGYLMIAFSHDKRGLHDEICDTVVVRDR